MNAITEMQDLKAAGFTDADIGGWALQRRKELSDAGFGQGEIDTYFGHPPFDPTPVKAHIEETLKQATAPTTEGGQPKPITGFLDALKAAFGEGFDESVTGLLLHGKPTATLSPDAPRSSRIAAQVGSLAGDVPAMIAGAVVGGGPASPVTSMAGAFALPQGMRKILMDKYEKGEVQGFSDFWDRFSGAFIDTAKGWITGAATGAVGKAMGAAPIVSPTAKSAATVTGEITTMVTVGKALEGQVPNADDFIDATLALGFVKGSVKVASKLRTIYAETGVKPEDVAQDVQRDPTILRDLAAENVTIPKAYQDTLADRLAKTKAAETGKRVERRRTGDYVEVAPTPSITDLAKAQQATVANTSKTGAFHEPDAPPMTPMQQAQRLAESDHLLIPFRGELTPADYLAADALIARDKLDQARAQEPDRFASERDGQGADMQWVGVQSGYPDWYVQLTHPAEGIEDAKGTRHGLSALSKDTIDAVLKDIANKHESSAARQRARELVEQAIKGERLTVPGGDEFARFMLTKDYKAPETIQPFEKPRALRSAEEILQEHNILRSAEEMIAQEPKPVLREKMYILPKGRGVAIAPEAMAEITSELRQHGIVFGEEGEPTWEENVPVQEAQSTVLDRIVQKDPGREKMSLSAIYTSIFDNLNPIYKAMEKGDATALPTSKNPYELERLTRGTMGKGTEFIKHGAFRFDTYETVTRGYEQILAPVKKDLDGFRAYMVAKRAVEKAGQGIETGIPLEEAKAITQAGKEKYEAVFQERLQYRNALLDYLEQSGILSASKKRAMQEANKEYVPFYRFFEDPTTGGPGSSRAVRDPIKEMKGSSRKILDPIVSDIKDTFLFVGLAEKNAARRAFVELGESVAVPVKTKADAITKQDIQTIVKEHGVSAEAASAVASIKAASRRSQADELTVFIDGERKVYKVDPKVAEAFVDQDKISTNFLTEMFVHTPANLLRAGVVVTPEYIARNVIRDAVSAFIYAGTSPLKTAKGLKSIVTQDTAFHNWLKGGGGNATMVALDRDYIHNHLVDLNVETGMLQRAWNVARTPLDILRATSELIENSTRLGAVHAEMKATQDKAKIQALSMIAREATVDFARHGKNTQEFGKMTAFFNPTLQGIDRFTREMQANPLGTTAKAMAAVTLPSLLLWYANKDDEEIANLPRWQKMAFWMTRVPLPEGRSFILRIPMPQEFGLLFGAIPERLLDAYMRDNPHALNDLDKALLQAFTPSFTPTLAVPIISQFANRDTFRGQPIIPQDLEGLLPEYQYMPYTTELAKAMGQLLGAFPGMEDAAVRNKDPFIGGTARALSTPVLIETYLRDWTGGMGMYLFQLADKALREAGALPDPVEPASSLADLPIIKAFVARYPSSSAQSIQDFYDQYDASKKYFDTMMNLAKQGDPRAESLMQAHQDDLVQLSDIRQALTMQSQIIRMVHKNPDLSADDKRQLIDTLYYRMVELSRAGNEGLRSIHDKQK